MKEKQTVKLNETQLRSVVKESVKRILNESVSMNIEDCLIRFKEVADNVLSCMDRYFEDDVFGDGNNEYYAFMKRMAEKVSVECEKMLSTVYNQGPKEI